MRDRGQGAARDSPRCLTAAGTKTKSEERTMVKDSKTVNIFSTKIVCFTFQVFDSQSIIFANLFSPKKAGQLVAGQ